MAGRVGRPKKNTQNFGELPKGESADIAAESVGWSGEQGVLLVRFRPNRILGSRSHRDPFPFVPAVGEAPHGFFGVSAGWIWWC